jgi:hypothetical protein
MAFPFTIGASSNPVQAESCPGLYFIGLLFLYSLSSSLVGGVGQDAEHIVHHIVSTRAAGRKVSSVEGSRERSPQIARAR